MITAVGDVRGTETVNVTINDIVLAPTLDGMIDESRAKISTKSLKIL